MPVRPIGAAKLETGFRFLLRAESGLPGLGCGCHFDRGVVSVGAKSGDQEDGGGEGKAGHMSGELVAEQSRMLPPVTFVAFVS